MNIKELKELWAQNGFRPHKSMGQNFLIDKNVRDNIVNAIFFDSPDEVMEIGSGFGVMTFDIASRCNRLVAVEKDRGICGTMEPLFKEKGNIEMLCADVLEVDIASIAGKGSKITVFGNIPYYISTPVLEKVINERQYVKSVFLVMQDELATRIASPPGSRKYGSISCFVQFYGHVKKMFKISNHCFYPKPKVDSALLKIDILEKPSVDVRDEDQMFDIIHKAFSQRRKKAINPLSDGENALKTRDEWIDIFTACGIDTFARAESLSLEDYAKLSDAVSA